MFLIDANVFIQAANSFYAFDLAPRFWDWLEGELGENVCTIVPVRAEVYRQNDELCAWVKQLDDPNWVFPVDGVDVQSHMPAISQHCFDYGYKEAGIKKFLSGADPWVIAKAKESSMVVVTHETADPAAKKRVKIPDVCDHFHVENILLFDMLRKLDFKFT